MFVKGKVCLITGATRGIGKAAATGLAERGATVVIVSRDSGRGESAKSEIIEHSGSDRIEVLVADLSSQQAIRDLVEDFQARYSDLHVLINNAGLVKKERSLTVDGLEMTFAVNYLAPFLLTNLLLDLMKASAPARIINVSSLVQKWGHIDFDDLMGENDYDMDRAYNQSKLADILFTYELARRIQGSGVTVNSYEPGMTRSRFGEEYTGFKAFMNVAWRPFMRSPEKAAQTGVFLADSLEIAEVSGKHFEDMKPIRTAKESYDEEVARRLWDASAELVGLT